MALAAALAAAPAHAVITAGPHGQFQGLQAAFNALVASPTEVELRIERGTRFTENLILTINANRAFKIGGGWDSTFATQTVDPSLTVLDGNFAARVLQLNVNAGTLDIGNVTFTHGLISNNIGGGFSVVTNTAGTLARFSDIDVLDNYSISTSSANFGGGAIYALAFFGAIEIRGTSHISNNRALSLNTGAAYGGGIYMAGFAGTSLSLAGSPAQPVTIDNNVADGGANAISVGGACAIYVNGTGGASVAVNGTVITGNRVRGVQGYRSGCDIGISDSNSFTAHQNVIYANVEDAQTNFGTSQVYATVGQNATMDITDTVVSNSVGAGLHLGTGAGSTLRMVNLSISGNQSGLLLDNVNGVTLYNSIVAQNGADLAPPVLPAGDHNLIAGDPHFVVGDPYLHIQADSPVRDAGNDNPPGGLSAADIDGETRLFQSHVDIGADEIGDPIFANGFEP
jgi:hypothetical protein